jgi:hypothetical protein
LEHPEWLIQAEHYLAAPCYELLRQELLFRVPPWPQPQAV